MKINDQVKTSANWKRNDKKNELGDISKKMSQQIPNSKSYPLRRRQKEKVCGSGPDKGEN